MDWISQYQVFLFDFDGLLVDTEETQFASYKELCARHGRLLPWDFAQFCQEAHGTAGGVWEGMRRECPEMFTHAPQEVLYAEKKAIYIEILHTTSLELMPGAEPLLRLLQERDIRRAVATNSPRDHIEIIKQRLPLLNSIPLWVTREQYVHPKPAPDAYLKALEQLKAPEDRVIGFEDSFHGLKALLAAGVDAMLICPEELPYVPEAKTLGARHFPHLAAVHI